MKKVQKIEKIVLPTSFPIGPVNVFIVFGEKLTLIDTGLNLDQAWIDLNEGLRSLDIQIEDLDQIVLTHHHNDHAGMLHRILEVNPTLDVYTHEHTKIYLQDKDYASWSGEYFERLFHEFGLSKEIVDSYTFRRKSRKTLDGLTLQDNLHEGSAVPGMPGWQVMETKGHSMDHISLYCPEDEIFICGDHVIQDMHAGIFLDAPLRGMPSPKMLVEYIRDLEKCKTISAKLTYSSHGPEFTDHIKVIDDELRNIKHRITRTIEALRKIGGSGTGFEIIREMYQKRLKQALFPFVFEIFSVLQLLEEKQIVTAEKIKGVYQYRLHHQKG